MAARFGLLLAERLGYDQVVLEGDALNVIKKLNAGSFGRSLLDLLLERNLMLLCVVMYVEQEIPLLITSL